MTIETFPLILPSELDFKPVPNSHSSLSSNNYSEVWAHPGGIWTFNATWRNIRYANARVLNNFLLNLDGQAGQFKMWDSTHSQLGSWGGTVVVDGNDQTGRLLSIRGATPSTLIAPAGDRFEINDYLYQLTQDAVADGTGRCDLRFWPELIVIPADGTALITTNPTNKMMLQDNNQGPSFARRKLNVRDFSIAGYTSKRA